MHVWCGRALGACVVWEGGRMRREEENYNDSCFCIGPWGFSLVNYHDNTSTINHIVSPNCSITMVTPHVIYMYMYSIHVYMVLCCVSICNVYCTCIHFYM